MSHEKFTKQVNYYMEFNGYNFENLGWVKADLNFPDHVELYTLRKFLSLTTKNIFNPNYFQSFWPVSDASEKIFKNWPLRIVWKGSQINTFDKTLIKKGINLLPTSLWHLIL